MDSEGRMESREETKNTTRIQRKTQHTNKITNPRSESRKQFMTIHSTDPKTRLQELPLKQAKERRQNIIKENRVLKQGEEKKDAKQLVEIMKELRQTLDSYMETTTKEIQNIKNIVEYGHKINEEKHKRLEIIEKDLKGIIQGIINQVKEIDQRNKAMETVHIPSDKWTNTRAKYWKNKDSNKSIDSSKNIAYEKFKESIKSAVTKDMHTPYSLQREIAKAILLDRYIPNKACVVVRNERGITKYQWSVSNTYTAKRYYVRYEGKWRRMKYIFNELKDKGLIFGRNSIINALKERSKLIKNDRPRSTQSPKSRLHINSKTQRWKNK